MVAIEINGEIKIYSEIPNTWNNILNYNSESNIEQQYEDGWRPVYIPTFNNLIEKLSPLYLDGETYRRDVVQLPDDSIAANISDSLGNYLDDVYPLWERIKHTAYGSECMLAMIQGQEYDAEKLAKVQNLLAWVTRCREAAEQMIIDVYAEGIMPDFNFELRPE